MPENNLTVQAVTTRATWNNTLETLPYAHVLQSWEWGEFKRITGWQTQRLAFYRDGEVVALASVGVRRVGPLRVMYVPKGPVLDYSDRVLTAGVLAHLRSLARRQSAVWLKIDPDLPAATGVPGDSDDTPDANGQATLALLRAGGWRFSREQVQFRNTITIDLTRDEDALLAAMSQNTRRKVRTAEKKGVTVRPATLDDLPTLYDLYRVTGARDGFLIRPAEYYLREWHYLMEAGLAHALIAEAEGKAIAQVILFHFGRKAWYFYGASADTHRDRMPNYLLQWEAIRWARAQRCTVYDMWGAPDIFSEADSMWGVYEFKRGFRGTVTRHIGAWDSVPFQPLYSAYTRVWPHILNALRRRR